MKLNRNNYEEYFLLYTDNELSIADRKLVEDFVNENTDLKIELENFLNSTLALEPQIVFENKEILYKNTNKIINESNFESFQLSFIDNELDEDQINELKSYHSSHPVASQNLELLFETKLVANLGIQHPDKNSLYAENIGKRKPILFPYWVRISVAASIILAISLFIFNPLKLNKAEEELASNNNPTILISPIDTKTKGFLTTQPKILNPVEKNNSEKQLLAETVKDRSLLNENISEKNKQNNSEFIVSKQAIKPNQKSEELNPVKQLNVNVNSVVHANITNSKIKAPQQLINNSLVTSDIVETYNSQSNEANDLFIYAAAEDKSNKMFRGFFRKATRLFEKTTNINATDGEERLLIAGLAINLK